MIPMGSLAPTPVQSLVCWATSGGGLGVVPHRVDPIQCLQQYMMTHD